MPHHLLPRPLVAVIAACAVASAVATTAAASAPPRHEKLQRALDKQVTDGAAGGILLVRHGERTRVFTSGVADRATRARVRSTDRFRIGSLTKTFVGAAVLQLVGEGRLGLDDTVEQWLPRAVPNGAAMTVRQLLNHTSGLFDYFNDERVMAPYTGGNLSYRYTPERLLALATAHAPLFAPGSRHEYNNTGYVVLELIVARATGRSLGDELERRIFKPLRLRHTSYGRGPRRLGRNAHPYARLDGRLTDLNALDLSFEAASGAIVSTAGDVARFYRALVGGRLLRPALLDAMQTVVTPGRHDYGLGIEKQSLPCGTGWGHTGATPGSTSTAWSTADGLHESVALVNREIDDMSKATQRAFFRLGHTALCAA